MPNSLQQDLRLCLRSDVVIEDFGDRSLIFLCDSLQLIEINAVTRRLIAWIESRTPISCMLDSLASEWDLTRTETSEMVWSALDRLEGQRILRRIVTLRSERTESMKEIKYLMRPEISFRQEDADGGILFNKVTEAIEIINPSAVEIWLALASPKTEPELVNHMCALFDGVDRDEVTRDVAEFINLLLTKGYIGIVENQA